MKSLETVQKTFNVFRTLAKVAEILCIVSASICGVTALGTVILQNGGHIFSVFGQPIESFVDGDPRIACVKLLILAFTAAADAILFGLAFNYLKHEQADGTPFTETGAERLKMLGIRCIYIPIIARVISMAMALWQGVKNPGIADNLPSVVIGVALILVSLVFRYGAELERQNKVPDDSTKNSKEGSTGEKV